MEQRIFLTEMATKAQRSNAHQIVERKLYGQARTDAIAFLMNRRRTARDLQNLVDRLATRPDLDRPCHSRARLSDDKVREMIRERFDGADLSQLANKYGLARATVALIATGKNRPALYQEVLAERMRRGADTSHRRAVGTGPQGSAGD